MAGREHSERLLSWTWASLRSYWWPHFGWARRSTSNALFSGLRFVAPRPICNVGLNSTAAAHLGEGTVCAVKGSIIGTIRFVGIG